MQKKKLHKYAASQKATTMEAVAFRSTFKGMKMAHLVADLPTQHLLKRCFQTQNIVFPLLKRAFMSVDIRNRDYGGQRGAEVGLGVCQSLMFITKEDENILMWHEE